MNWYIIAAAIVFIGGGVSAGYLLWRDHPNKLRFFIAAIISSALIIALVILGLLPHCVGSIPAASSGSPDCRAGSIRIDGSTAMQPLVNDVAQEYMASCPAATIQVDGGSSLKGLSDLETGTVQIGDSDIAADSSLYQGLEDHEVAIVIFVLILNKSVQGVTNLSTSQIQGIYNSTYTNWSQLGHNALPIHAISRAFGSGTRATFERYVLKGSPEKGTSTPSDSTASVISAVETTPGAIGYVSLHDALENANQITILTIDGHSHGDYTNNDYTFWNIEHMYTKQEASSDQLVQASIAYMGNTDVVKSTITTDSFVSINDVSSSALNAHC